MKRSIVLVFLGLLIASGLSFMHAQALSTQSTTVNHVQKDRLGKYSITRYRRSHPMASWSRTTSKSATSTAAAGVSPSVVIPQYSLQGTAALTPYTPLLTAVDPYSNAANSSDGLKPGRPFWYAVDNLGLTIFQISDNSVVHRVPWPETISVVQPDGEYVDVPAPAGGWQPVTMTVTYPTEEALASNSETPPTFVYVVMARSGFEWQSNSNPPAGQDPHLRDMLVPSTNPDTESSMLVSVDVSDPTFDPAESPTGPIIAGAILGHGAGQLAYDPGTDVIYVGNMPSASLPADLQSFVSVISALAPPVAEPAGAGPPAPEAPMVVMCGPEHPDEGLLKGEAYVFPCVESGDGPATWEFSGLPTWLKAHQDRITEQSDGLLYGTPTEDGTWTYQARVTDYGDTEAGPLTSEWMTFTVNVIPTGVASEVEAGFEAGIPGGQGITGTGSCTPSPSSSHVGNPLLPPDWQPSPTSMVPNWVDVIPQTTNGQVTGCYVLGTAPISGEYYEFALPNFHFAYPFDREPVLFSGNVVGPYMFDPLPAGVSISGLAWHQIEKLHDPSTEADVLNSEFIGVDPFTGQMYRILPPQGSIEVGTVVTAPEISVEPDTITLEGQPLLQSLTTLRPDIGAQLGTGQTVVFGDLAIEADRDIYVTTRWILNPNAQTVMPIGGGSEIADGAMLKVSNGAATAINVPGVQAYSIALDSNLAPAIPNVEQGQIDHGVLWAAGSNNGNLAVIDTAAGQVVQSLSVTGASSIGGLSVDTGLGFAYAANPLNISIFGVPGGTAERSPVIWSGAAATFTVGIANTFKVMTTGYPKPTLSYSGTLPSGVTFTPNQDGTATLAGTPPAGIDGDYSFNITASNGVAPEATQAFILTIAGAPTFTSAATTTFTVGSPGSFMITTTGAPSITVLWCTPVGDPTKVAPCPLPSWLTWTDNEDGTATIAGTPTAGSEGAYTFTFWASTGVLPDASQNFTLTVNAGSGGGGTPAAPVITSPAATTFTVGAPGSFTFTTTGSPAPTLSQSGALPGGVSFFYVGNGQAALVGTPLSGTQGTYTLAITATNSQGSVSQTFTLTVNPSAQTAPAITSASSADFKVGAPGSFAVIAAGTPTPKLSMWGTLPAGVTFVDNGNGTAALVGTPTSAGNFLFTITASNSVVPDATQNFTLRVAEADANLSVAPSSLSFAYTINGATPPAQNISVGSSGSALTYTVSTSGGTWLSATGGGTTPGSISVSANPAGLAAATYNGTVTITSAGAGNSPRTVAVTLTVAPAPTLSASPSTLSFAYTRLSTTMPPAQSISVGSSGSALSYTVSSNAAWLVAAPSSGNTPGTVNVSVNPGVLAAGSYNGAVTITSSGAGNSPQLVGVTLNIAEAPSLTVAPNALSFAYAIGGSNPAAQTFSIASNGQALSYTVSKGAGTWFSVNSNGGTTPGTVRVSINTSGLAAGTYNGTVTINSGAAGNGPQTLPVTLTVSPQAQPLQITTASLPNGTLNQPYSAQLAAQGGTPPYTWRTTGSLPRGVSMSTAGVLSGTPNRAGTYSFTVRVTDSAARTANKSFTITIPR